MNLLTAELPITKIKIFAAGLLYRVVRPFVGSDEQIVARGGIRYALDLTEGIDLHLYLFGKFQPHLFDSRLLQLPADAVILDVGANIGAMALQYAAQYPQARIYAFEPTDYAYAKLRRNVELNPELQPRIETICGFVSDADADNRERIAYSSWKVAGTRSEPSHPLHLGTRKSVDKAQTLSLDDFCREQNFSRIDLIKIDTDGNEFQVLGGARRCLADYRPAVIFELGIYPMREAGIEFSFYWELFSQLGYKLYELASGRVITMDNHAAMLPKKWAVDVIALPTSPAGGGSL